MIKQISLVSVLAVGLGLLATTGCYVQGQSSAAVQPAEVVVADPPPPPPVIVETVPPPFWLGVIWI
jgi:hypothetical protein